MSVGDEIGNHGKELESGSVQEDLPFSSFSGLISARQGAWGSGKCALILGVFRQWQGTLAMPHKICSFDF